MSAPVLEKRAAARKADEELDKYYNRTAAARKAKRQELRERAWNASGGAVALAQDDIEEEDNSGAMPPKTNPVASGSGGAVNGEGENNEVVVVKYDAEDKPDQGDVAGKLTSIANLPYDADNVDKWVRKLERRMETGGIGTQWTKRLVLESALPAHLHDTWRSCLTRRRPAVVWSTTSARPCSSRSTGPSRSGTSSWPSP